MLARKQLLSALAGLAMLAMPAVAVAESPHTWNQNTPLHPQADHEYQRGERPRYAINQGWDNHPHNNGWDKRSPNYGNWIRNEHPGWNPPVFRDRPLPPPPVYSYRPGYRQYAADPSCDRLSPPNAYQGNYGGYGNGYGDGNGYSGGYGYGGGYGNVGGLYALRNNLLQERAGAYQQLEIRQRTGDHNGARHLWNTIHSLDRQIARVSQSINQRG